MIFDLSCGILEDTKKALKEIAIIIAKIQVLIVSLFINFSRRKCT